jgi:hypothetical protein
MEVISHKLNNLDSTKICRQQGDHLLWACHPNLILRFLIMKKKMKVGY